MPIVRALVEIPNVSALPEDVATNTWHFDADDVLQATIDAIHAELTTFYQAIDTYLSPRCGTAATVTYYNLDDPTPRVPLDTQGITLSINGAQDALPDEVACCMSFQATPQSGLNQARRRGRIYLGPLGDSSSGTTATTANRPLAAFLTAVAAAGDALMTAGGGAAPWAWVVWSETAQDAAFVADGWVDNSYDTQRRRGAAPTSRTTWT